MCAYDIVYDMQYDTVYDVVYYIVYDIVYDIIYDEHRQIYSCCLAAAAKRWRFKVSTPLRLDSEALARHISSASSTEIFLGDTLP